VVVGVVVVHLSYPYQLFGADGRPWQPRIISMADKDGDGVISKKELDEAKAVVAGS
jgi:hypothetical protein